MKYSQWCVLSVFGLAAILSAAAQGKADEAQDDVVKDEPLKIEKRITVVAHAESEYWIGVYAVPVDAALKSHLGIAEDHLMVQEVIDGSPAQKAGLQAYDVLLKYGEASIATVADLEKAVGQAEGKETSLALIRGGKKKSLNVTAEKRPEGQVGLHVDVANVGDLQGLIGGWIQNHGQQAQGGSPLKFRFLGPGVVEGGIDVKELHEKLLGQQAKMPKNLSIQINKTGDTPAKITVTRDGETWEVTEENLDKLPEDVRPHVKRSLGGHAGVAIAFGEDGQNLRLKALQVHPEIKLNPGATPRVIQPGSVATPKTRSFQFRAKALDADDDGDVDQLRKDVEELKAAVKKLQGEKTRKNKKDDN